MPLIARRPAHRTHGFLRSVSDSHRRPLVMPRSRAVVRAALAAVVGLTVAGCGEDGRSGGTRDGSPATSSDPDSTSSVPAREQEQMRIRIAIGDERLEATIVDSAAGRDLIARLPLTIDMTDHGSVEKTGPLPAPLSTEDQPDGADPEVADVGYYAPGNDLVLYYGDQSFFPGIVIIGRLDGDAAGRIAAMPGVVTATVEAVAA